MRKVFVIQLIPNRGYLLNRRQNIGRVVGNWKGNAFAPFNLCKELIHCLSRGETGETQMRKNFLDPRFAPGIYSCAQDFCSPHGTKREHKNARAAIGDSVLLSHVSSYVF